MIKRNEFIMFIKTTDSNLVNLDALAAIKIDGFSIIARGRDVVHDGISPGRLGISKLYLISTLSDEEKAEIEKSIATQSPLHEMKDPDNFVSHTTEPKAPDLEDGTELLKEVISSTAHTETISND